MWVKDQLPVKNAAYFLLGFAVQIIQCFFSVYIIADHSAEYTCLLLFSKYVFEFIT